jgi:SOS-response transcriptional repressor LexA
MSNLTADQKRDLSKKKVGTYFGSDEKEKLTSVQEKVYAYIAGYIEDNKYSPTYQEIAMRTDLTTQMVESHVKNIAKKGWIQFNGKKFRKIELIPKGNE